MSEVVLDGKRIADLGQLMSASPEDQEAMEGILSLSLANNRITTLIARNPIQHTLTNNSSGSSTHSDDGRTSDHATQGDHRAIAHRALVSPPALGSLPSSLTVVTSVLLPLRSLRKLNLSGNQLKNLEGLAGVASTLQELIVNENFLMSFRGLEKCNRLQLLVAKKNQIESLEGLPEIRPPLSPPPGGETSAAATTNTTSPQLRVDLEGNFLSNILHLLDCPFILESLSYLNLVDNPLPLVTQLPLVLEQCLQPKIEVVVRGTTQEREVIKGLVGSQVQLTFDLLPPVSSPPRKRIPTGDQQPHHQPFDLQRLNDSAIPIRRNPPPPPTMMNATVAPPERPTLRQQPESEAQGQGAAASSRKPQTHQEVQPSSQPLDPSSSQTSRPINVSHQTNSNPHASYSRSASTHSSMASESQLDHSVEPPPTFDRSAALQTYLKMPDRELVQHLVATREENAKYEMEARKLKKQLKEFKKLVSDDVCKMRDMKNLIDEQDLELMRLRDRLKKKTSESEALKSQLDQARFHAQSQALRSSFYEKENHLLENHIAHSGPLNHELHELRSLCQRQLEHIAALTSENDHLTNALSKATGALGKFTAQSASTTAPGGDDAAEYSQNDSKMSRRGNGSAAGEPERRLSRRSVDGTLIAEADLRRFVSASGQPGESLVIRDDEGDSGAEGSRHPSRAGQPRSRQSTGSRRNYSEDDAGGSGMHYRPVADEGDTLQLYSSPQSPPSLH